VDEVLIHGKGTLPGVLVARLQERVRPYRLGVEVQAASVAYLLPPEDVKSAFDDVTRAQASVLTQEEEARRQADQALRKAEGDRFQITEAAAAYAHDRVQMADTEAAGFEK